MIISKDSNNNWTPVATGNGQFVGTKAAFDAVKDDLPDNTVAYTTDDGEDTLTATCSDSRVSIERCLILRPGVAEIQGYIKRGSSLSFSEGQTNFSNVSITGKTILGLAVASLFIYTTNSTNFVTTPATWKINGNWLTVPGNIAETLTLANDAWFSAIVNYR